MQQDAASVFSGSGIRISMEGRPYLGAAIGSDSYVNSFVVEKVKGWSAEVRRGYQDLRRVSPMLWGAICLKNPKIEI